jgi:exonuclease III
MKLISLNTWGGKVFDPLIKFVKENQQNTDIFCFQEIYDNPGNIIHINDSGVRTNLLSELQKVLFNFDVFYFPVLFDYIYSTRVDIGLRFGVAIFIKKKLKADFQQNCYIYKSKSKFLKKDYSNLSTPLQIVSFKKSSKTYFVFNFHGTPAPGAKKDTIKRLNQSKKILYILKCFKGAKILAGDFNLSKNTKSIQMIDAYMKNLIKIYSTERTRSKKSPFWGKSNFQKFADYTFVSDDISVESFSVPDVSISDHLPMILEFS